jgi:hypothetical protein
MAAQVHLGLIYHVVLGTERIDKINIVAALVELAQVAH